MGLFIITFYDVRTIFHKIIELTHSKIFYSHKNQTIKQLNYDILPVYMLVPIRIKSPHAYMSHHTSMRTHTHMVIVLAPYAHGYTNIIVDAYCH